MKKRYLITMYIFGTLAFIGWLKEKVVKISPFVLLIAFLCFLVISFFVFTINYSKRYNYG